MMVNGCGYLRRTAIAFPIGALVASSYLLLGAHSPNTYMVPLWVSGAEALVVCGVLLDVNRVLRFGGQSSFTSEPDVSAVAPLYSGVPAGSIGGSSD
jgi:hypothetical protein